MNLGKTIKDLRRRKELSQTDLAEKCRITSTYLSQLENNKKYPSPELAAALCTVFEVPVPILYFMAMDESDIPTEKLEAYRTLAPSMNLVIGQLFPGGK
jgi:transcriptional regulator with XRE-family HTH domain